MKNIIQRKDVFKHMKNAWRAAAEGPAAMYIISRHARACTIEMVIVSSARLSTCHLLLERERAREREREREIYISRERAHLRSKSFSSHDYPFPLLVAVL